MIDLKTRDRAVQMDLLRVAACMMVIMSHVVAEGMSATIPGTFQGYVMLAFCLLARPAVPVFFMLSGMFSRVTDWKKSGRKTLGYVLILVATALLYQIVDVIDRRYILKTMQEPFETVLKEVFVEGLAFSKYHLWFLPKFIAVALMAPVVNAAVEKKSALLDYMVIWFLLGTILPESIKGLFPECRPLRVWSNLLPESRMEYLGYYVLGRWLVQNKERIKRSSRVIVYLLYGCSLVIRYILMHLLAMDIGNYNDWYCSHFIVFSLIDALAIIVFFGQIKVPDKYKPAILWLASKGLGIYLVHVFFVETVTRLGFWPQRITTIIGVPLKTVLVFALSCLFLWGIDRLCDLIKCRTEK